MSKKHGKNLERDLNGVLIEAVHDQGFPVVVGVDQDSPARTFQSGYDFLIARKKTARFVEAKRIIEGEKVFQETDATLFGLMSAFQHQWAFNCWAADVPYLLAVFKIKKALKVGPAITDPKSPDVVVDLYQVQFSEDEGAAFPDFHPVLHRASIGETAELLAATL